MNHNERGEVQEKKTEWSSATVKEEKKKGKKTRLTVLDFLLVILLLLCLVGLLFRAAVLNWFDSRAPLEKITVSFKIDGISVDGYEHWQKDLVWMLDGEELGSVSDITSEPYQTAVLAEEDGMTVFHTVNDPTRYTVRGKLTVTGRYEDTGITFGENGSLNVGKILKVTAGSSVLTVTITEIPRP